MIQIHILLVFNGANSSQVLNVLTMQVTTGEHLAGDRVDAFECVHLLVDHVLPRLLRGDHETSCSIH